MDEFHKLDSQTERVPAGEQNGNLKRPRPNEETLNNKNSKRRELKYEILYNGDLFQYKDASGNDHTLYRIKALKNFTAYAANGAGATIQKDEVGGLIEHDGNLDQDGTSWVFPGSIVCGTGRVEKNATAIHGSAICDKVLLTDDTLADNSKLSDRVTLFGKSSVWTSELSDRVTLYDASGVWNSKLSNGVILHGKSSAMSSNLSNGVSLFGESSTVRSTLSNRVTLDDKSHVMLSNLSNRVTLDGESNVQGSKLSNKVTLYDGSSVLESELSNGVTLYNKSRVHNSSLNDNITVRNDGRITDSIVNDSVLVCNRGRIEKHSTVSDNVIIPQNAIIWGQEIHGNICVSGRAVVNTPIPDGTESHDIFRLGTPEGQRRLESLQEPAAPEAPLVPVNEEHPAAQLETTLPNGPNVSNAVPAGNPETENRTALNLNNGILATTTNASTQRLPRTDFSNNNTANQNTAVSRARQ